MRRPQRRQANSQAGWALVTGGVATARVEVHRLHQILNKVKTIVDRSPAKERIYQVAGDLIEASVRRLETTERALDVTTYALSKMGEDHLKDRLPISQRALVDETVEAAKAFSPALVRESALAHRVFMAYMGKVKQ